MSLPVDYFPTGYACPKGTPGCGEHNAIHVSCDVTQEMARRYTETNAAACGHAVTDRLDLHWSAELADEVCPDCCEDCNP